MYTLIYIWRGQVISIPIPLHLPPSLQAFTLHEIMPWESKDILQPLKFVSYPPQHSYQKQRITLSTLSKNSEYQRSGMAELCVPEQGGKRLRCYCKCYRELKGCQFEYNSISQKMKGTRTLGMKGCVGHSGTDL